MKYITDFNGIYRISNRNWQRFLKATASGLEAYLEDFGAKQIGIVERDISDFTQEQAQEELNF